MDLNKYNECQDTFINETRYFIAQNIMRDQLENKLNNSVRVFDHRDY